MTIRPTRRRLARRSSSGLLAFPCSRIRSGGKPAAAAQAQLAGRADVQSKSLVSDPVGHRGAQEGLGRVQHLGVRQGGAVGTGARPYLGLVQDVQRGAEAVPPPQRGRLR